MRIFTSKNLQRFGGRFFDVNILIRCKCLNRCESRRIHIEYLHENPTTGTGLIDALNSMLFWLDPKVIVNKLLCNIPRGEGKKQLLYGPLYMQLEFHFINFQRFTYGHDASLLMCYILFQYVCALHLIKGATSSINPPCVIFCFN